LGSIWNKTVSWGDNSDTLSELAIS